MKKQIPLVLIILTLAACRASAPDLAAVQTVVAATQAALPSATAYPTYTPQPAWPTHTPYPTYTPGPTQTPHVVIVTETATPTPLYTATITPTPTQTPLPSPTLDPLTEDKAPGVYLVNVDIAPGLWRNNGVTENCYWQRSSKTGGIIDNYFGLGGGTIFIAATDFQVELHVECGTWTYLGRQ
ncbi:MAG TPA: hypothetical protein PKW33_19775 [Anaerolineaceae bacterium]|nr:hypothetical protein [Anaerolineaceae bacterium]HPN53845.1 hypothetical protein [Anaerolineaceae bacterium]